MKTEIQRFDAIDDAGTVHTIVELHEDLAGRSSYANVAHVERYVAFSTTGGELLYPMGGGKYKLIRNSKVLRRMFFPSTLRTPVSNC
jgi:hypothetical protein